MLWLGRRWSVELSGFGGCFESKEVFFEEGLLDLLHVLLDGPAVNGLVLYCYGMNNILLLGSVGSYRIGLGHLTYGWSLMVLKTSLMGVSS